MPGVGFGFGQARGQRSHTGAVAPPPSQGSVEQYGALSRNSPGAGILTSATSIVSGDAGGHWTIASGRLFPSAAGDAADLNASPYVLALDNGQVININIEPATWDIADQSEWDAVAMQDPSVLAGKTIALRHQGELNLGIDGTAGTPFRNATYEDAGGNPCTVKGRFGDVGDWEDYPLIDKVAAMRGAIGVRFEHLRTTPAAETKFGIISQSSGNRFSGNITIHDCWITGAVGDPNGDYSTSSNYPNQGVDLINTGGKTGEQGSVTVSGCLIEWGGTLCNISVDGTANVFTFSDNEARFYYGDAVQAVNFANRAAGAFMCSGNFIHSCVGRADDSGNSHADSIRVQGSTTATGDFVITIENNVILPGNARGDAQGIFIDDMKSGGTDSGQFFIATVRNNIVQVVETGHGITIGQPKDCLIENNTILGNNDGSTQIVFVGTAGGTQGTDGGGNIVRNNIVEVLNLTAGTPSNNFELGLNGANIPYATVLTGPIWTPTTAEDAKSLFLPTVAAGAVFGSQLDTAPTILNPTIEGSPEDGQTITMSLQAAGFPAPFIAYQWRKNGVDIGGANTAEITLDAATMALSDGDVITCAVTASNIAGTATAEPSVGFVASPSEYLVQGATAGYFFDPENVPAGTTRITFRGKLYWPTNSMSNNQRPFNINSSGADLALLGNRSMQVTVEDSTFQKMLLAEPVPGLLLQEDTWYSFVFDVDQVGQTATVTVNGIVYVLPFTAPSSGLFQTGQKVGLLGTSIGSLTVAAGVRAADLSVDFNGVLHKAISDDPALANLDAWHAGGDFSGAP